MSILNKAQIQFLDLLAQVKTEEELEELRRVVARHLLEKARAGTVGIAEELGVDTKGGAKKFVRENHERTPYE